MWSMMSQKGHVLRIRQPHLTHGEGYDVSETSLLVPVSNSSISEDAKLGFHGVWLSGGG